MTKGDGIALLGQSKNQASAVVLQKFHSPPSEDLHFLISSPGEKKYLWKEVTLGWH